MNRREKRRMMTEEQIKKKLKTYINAKRFTHTIGVLELAKELAKRYDISVDQASVAALLHDCAKELSGPELLKIAKAHEITVDRLIREEPQLLHGPVGAIVAKRDFGIMDKVILDAIHYHTTGRKKMTPLDKLIYLADFIEPNRNYPGVDRLRKLAQINLDRAVLEALNESLSYLIKKGRVMHKCTVSARNDMIFNLKNIK